MADFETIYKEYMPLIAPPATAAERPTEYAAALDVMTFTQTTNPADDAAWHQFFIHGATLTTEILDSYRKLYMPTRGLVYYFSDGAALPNGKKAMGTTLMIRPSTASQMQWSKFHPAYSGFVTEMYFSNFDETLMDTNLRTYLTGDPTNKDFLAWIYSVYISPELPDETAIADSVYSLFKGSLAGILGIYVAGGDELSRINADGTEVDTYRLDCLFTNSHCFPLASGDDYYEAFFTEVRGIPDDNDALDISDTAEFFRYRQRMRDSDHTFAHLAAHPMIILMTAYGAGYSSETSSLTNTNRAFILDIYVSTARLDFVDYENTVTNKHQNQSNYVDVDADVITIMLRAPFSTEQIQTLTGKETLSESDVEFDYEIYMHDTERRSLNIYNPDNSPLSFEYQNGYVSTYRSSTQIYFTLEDSIPSPLTEPIYDTVRITRGTILVRKIRVMICPTLLIPGHLFNVAIYERESGTGYEKLVASGSNNNSFEHTYPILARVANIFFYPAADAQDISVTLDESENGVIKTNIDGSSTRSAAFQSLLNEAGSGFNLFWVYDIEGNEPGDTGKEAGIAIGLKAFAEGNCSKTDAYEAVCSHELLHAIANGYFSSSADSRHFHHTKNKSGDFLLSYNTCARKVTSAHTLLTSNQVWLLHKKLDSHF